MTGRGRLVGLLVAASLVAACASVSDEAAPSATVDESEAEPSTSTTVAFEAFENPVDDGNARALITPSGVMVSVVATTDDGYLVITPCGNEALLTEGESISRTAVVIDPGHGGDIETGSVGPNGLVEAELNLEVAEATVAELERRNIDAVLTRTGDYRVTLATRARIANTLGSLAFVSIHHTGPQANPSDHPGVEVYVQRSVTESQRLGGAIHQAVFDAFEPLELDWQSASDAGVLVVLNADGANAYGLIRRPAMPAALIELGYLANPAEAEYFAGDDYPPLAADALADGIESWLTTSAVGTELNAEPRIFTPSGLTGGSDSCEDPPLG